MNEQNQQVTEKYLFIITPIEIKSSSKIRTNSRKSVLIKLGNKTAKCPALNSPVQLEIDVLYSKTLQKYCPLKGIIKIYDVSEDGTEIISCVGGFQTDELLNHSKHQIILEKEIGTSKLKMEITIVNKGQGQGGKTEGQGQGLGQSKVEEGRPALSAREGQPKEETRRREEDSLRKQLDISQRNSLRSSSILSGTVSGSILQGINSNRRGPSPSLKRELSSQRLTHLASSGANLNYESVEASRTVYELEHNKKELIILKKLAGEKDKKIVSLERQLSGAELTIKNLKETNKHLGEENQYLRQKNEKVELAHYHKETLIVSLNDQMDKMTVELQQLDGKLYNCSLEIEELREEVANCNEVIEKYREKHGDLKGVKNKAIEMEIKDCLRWIELQNRDFDMSEMAETTPSEQGEQGEITPSDTTPSDQGEDHSLSSVIRGIEIEKVPKEEMGVIRDQLLRILDKVDEMMNK